MDQTEKRPSTAFTSIDYDKKGKQAGFIMIPHSPHEDAWGATRVPIAVIANGTGPTVIIEGGNHGDEYEGPIAIAELIRDLDPGAIQGRLILLPAINVNAAMAGARTSPVDGLNFNRTFPGDPHGSITQQIAAYMMDVLFPMGDAFLDLHSGGSSLDLLPSAIIEPSTDPELRRKNIEAAKAFDAPLTVVIDNMGDPRTAPSLLRDTSPVNQAARAGGPVLLVAGDSDTVVAPVQSQRMLAALRDSSKYPSELVSIAGDDHYLLHTEARVQMLKAVDAFLAKNLPVGP